MREGSQKYFLVDEANQIRNLKVNSFQHQGKTIMPIDKYTLHKDRKSEKWRLEKEGTDRAKRVFETKADALTELRYAVGPNGGSVRIRKVDNTIQEERTYPRSKDPKSSPG